jgi:hypothetical protein
MRAGWRRAVCTNSAFINSAAWIPDTLRSLRSLTRPGMTGYR